MSSNISTSELKWLITNSTDPLVFESYFKTNKLLFWRLEDWQQILDNRELEFRCGKYKRTVSPQWEYTTETRLGTFADFLKHAEADTWIYFDYKYLKNWFTDIEEIRNNLSWTSLGFPEIKPEDCTIWIGTKGAHTCCHMDTYGFNLIFQIYGSKMWTVFPPEENLRPTRVPYEESSVYSQLNFFSPTVDHFKGIGKCRQITLKPGDVLLLPHKWWHYVENLETSISVNVWLPHPEDDVERFKESLVQLIVKQISKDLDNDARKVVINPNMQEEIANTTLKMSMELVNGCKTLCSNRRHKKLKSDVVSKTEIKELNNTDEIILKYNFITQIPILSEEEFMSFCQKQSDRFGPINEPSGSLKSEEKEDIESVELLNVFTDSEVMSLVSSKLLKLQDREFE